MRSGCFGEKRCLRATAGFGFGDPTSVSIVEQVTLSTKECGAIRHGAECFNFYFPQELDDEFLIVWDGLVSSDGVPWKSVTEPVLRAFLLERIRDGYAFPLNPAWVVRDTGWDVVFDELRNSQQCRLGSANFESWYSEEILDLIAQIRGNLGTLRKT